jgi:Na+/H+ antiporter
MNKNRQGNGDAVNFIEAAVFILFLAIVAVPLATRMRLPLEIFLVIGSCLISMIPGLPYVQINPMIVFDIFLPPILFSAAYFTSWREFKFNIRPISLLGIGLVLFTTCVIAALTRWLIPGFTWAEGFLLGAIISPTDSAAATSIVKKLGVSRRFTTIVEGESLINDASGLILYRFSLAAVIYGSFSFQQALGEFLMISTGGALVGLAIGYIALRIEKKLRDVSAETTFTFITAFTSFLVAERLGVSGVISTVVSGLYFGLHFPESAQSQTRFQAKASWNTLLFIINGFVFTLIGFEIPFLLSSLGAYKTSELILYGAMVSISVILLRLIWIYPAALLPRIIMPSLLKKDPMPRWQFLFAIGWTGMRGILSLAAVLAIPRYLPSGAPFPHLQLLLFLTYCVVVTTLLIPSLTMPPLMRWLEMSETEAKMKEEALARIRAMEGIIDRVSELAKKEKIPHEILNEFRRQIERRIVVVKTQLNDVPYSTLSSEYLALKKMTAIAIIHERETLIRLRKEGEIHDEVFHALADELDIEEMRLNSMRI